MLRIYNDAHAWLKAWDHLSNSMHQHLVHVLQLLWKCFFCWIADSEWRHYDRYRLQQDSLISVVVVCDDGKVWKQSIGTAFSRCCILDAACWSILPGHHLYCASKTSWPSWANFNANQENDKPVPPCKSAFKSWVHVHPRGGAAMCVCRVCIARMQVDATVVAHHCWDRFLVHELATRYVRGLCTEQTHCLAFSASLVFLSHELNPACCWPVPVACPL